MSLERLEPCFRPGELAGRSLADVLLEIQQYTSVNSKFFEWIARIECLSVATEDGKTLILEPIHDNTYSYTHKLRDFIAVSYSCDGMSEFDSDDSGAYEVKQGPGATSVRHSRTRDDVLERVMKFRKHVKCPHFWTSEDCVDPSNEQHVKTAMGSMELIYGSSKYPLGLMSTILQTDEQIRCFRMLLKGKLATTAGINSKIDKFVINQAVMLLKLLSKDRWWDRAWVYQEEYFANIIMTVLIRHSPALEDVKKKEFHGDPLGTIEGEILFNVSDFRKQTTIFLLGLRALKAGIEKMRFTNLIDCFGKYNVLYKWESPANRKAMWSRIVADINRRGIGEKYDRLPIIANSCNYPICFDAQNIRGLPYSVNVFIVALIVGNGEIIANDKTSIGLLTETSLGDFLNQISFAPSNLPIGVRELSWLKNYRLPRPKIVASGVETEGYLWNVVVTLPTRNWKLPSSLRKTMRCRSKAERFDCLERLIQILRWVKGCRKLIAELEEYLHERAPTTPSQKAVRRYKDVMANEVCNAILNHQPLLLATPDGDNNTRAIFVGLSDRDTQMFTAWSYRKEEDERFRTRHVSMSVRCDKEEGTYHLELQTSANGLVFFTTSERRRMVVTWRKEFLQIFPASDESQAVGTSEGT